MFNEFYKWNVVKINWTQTVLLLSLSSPSCARPRASLGPPVSWQLPSQQSLSTSLSECMLPSSVTKWWLRFWKLSPGRGWALSDFSVLSVRTQQMVMIRKRDEGSKACNDHKVKVWPLEKEMGTFLNVVSYVTHQGYLSPGKRSDWPWATRRLRWLSDNSTPYLRASWRLMGPYHSCWSSFEEHLGLVGSIALVQEEYLCSHWGLDYTAPKRCYPVVWSCLALFLSTELYLIYLCWSYGGQTVLCT